jgi:hypothetical protein
MQILLHMTLILKNYVHFYHNTLTLTFARTRFTFMYFTTILKTPKPSIAKKENIDH